MTTQLIGLKDFRQNLATYTNKARLKQIRYIVLRKNIPVFEVKPISQKDAIFEQLAADIAAARQQVKAGKVYSQQQVRQLLGL